MISNLERAILITTAINVLLSRFSNYCKQYTIWNIIFILYAYAIDDSDEIMALATINTINIAITFHCFFIFEPNLLNTIPKAINMSLGSCYIKDIILHILPMYPLVKDYCVKGLSGVEYATHYAFLYSLLWVLIIMTHTLKIGDIYTLSDQYYTQICLIFCVLHVLIPIFLRGLGC